MNSILDWIRTNWNEESNVGKAKLGAVAALIFLLIASLLPDYRREPALSVPSAAVGGTEDAEGADAARQAAAAYSSYEARVAELEREAQAATEQAAAAYRSYEARVAELERERAELVAKQTEAGSLEDASEEVAATIRAYEARIIDLEQEKRDLTGEMAKLESGGEAAKEAAAAYASYEARVSELEQETQAGVTQAAQTYGSYEARVSELERAHQDLLEQLAAKDRRIAELERGAAGDGQDAASGTMELRLQLESMRATLDQLLKKLE